MSIQTYTRPRRAAVRPAARRPGPVTLAIRGIRPNELPSWEMREEEMRREEAAAMRALRRRVEKAVAAGIDFLDAINGDPDLEDGADDEPSLGASMADEGFGTNWLFGDSSDREDDTENDEPSLGSLGGTGATYLNIGHGYRAEPWAGGSDDDREQDAGDEPEALNEDGNEFGLGH